MENDNESLNNRSDGPTSGSPDPNASEKRRRQLTPVVRYLAIASWGAALAGLVAYFMRKVGY